MILSSALETTAKDSSEGTDHCQAPSGKPRSFFSSLVRSLVLVCLACVAFGGGVAFWTYLSEIEKLKNFDFRQPTQIFADSGELIAEFGVERRYPVPLDNIPQILQDAFWPEEGKDFWKPRGPSVNSIMRTAINVVRPREPDPSGTTYRSMPRRTPAEELYVKISRTIRETLRWKALKALTREQILYVYMNQTYLGSGAYGVEAASRTYFGKSVKDLTIAECAMIAGLTKAPGRDSPKHSMQRALERRTDVLQRMMEQEKIKQAEYDQATHEEPALVEKTNPYMSDFPGFFEYVRRNLIAKFGQDRLYKGGLKVYTSFDLALAKQAQEAISVEDFPDQRMKTFTKFLSNPIIKRIVDKRGEVLEEHGSRKCSE